MDWSLAPVVRKFTLNLAKKFRRENVLLQPRPILSKVDMLGAACRMSATAPLATSFCSAPKCREGPEAEVASGGQKQAPAMSGLFRAANVVRVGVPRVTLPNL